MSRYVRVSLWNVMNHSQNVTLKKASILDGWINQEGGFCVVMSRLPKIHRPIQYKDISASSMRVTNDQQGILEGLANKTGNIDYQDDRTCYGAWRKSLQEAYARKAQQNLDYIVPYLFNHDFHSLPPGGVVDADESRDGLHIKVQLNMDIPAGRDVFYSFKNGTLRKQSVGYRTIQCDYVKENGRQIRELKELALLECSCVVFPATDLARVTSVKGRNEYNAMLRNKDFTSNYQSQQSDDWLYDDWNDSSNALRAGVQELFSEEDGADPLSGLDTLLAQFAIALRSYLQEGIDLGYTGSSSSSDYRMMSMSGSDCDSKAGYLNADRHVAIAKAVDGTMTHGKTIKKALASVSSSRRSNESIGQPLYSAASDRSYF